MLCNAIQSTFSVCCDSLEVYYNGPLEYTYESIYGYYVRQEDLINGRPWYKNDGRSIWWDGKNNNWKLGSTTKKGRVQVDLLNWIMMVDVFQEYLIKLGNGEMALIGMMLETKSKSDVAINQKVNRH